MKSQLLKFICVGVIGIALGTGISAKLSMPAIAHAQEAVTSQAQLIESLQRKVEEQQRIIEARGQAIDALIARLKVAESNPAARALAETGHVMTEAQCLAWSGASVGPIPGISPQSAGAVETVLYESSPASLNLSLLPLPGAPRIALSPGSQLTPRWIIPGRIQPQVVGKTRQAIYYYFQEGSAQWQGPFAPLRVTQ